MSLSSTFPDKTVGLEKKKRVPEQLADITELVCFRLMMNVQPHLAWMCVSFRQNLDECCNIGGMWMPRIIFMCLSQIDGKVDL